MFVTYGLDSSDTPERIKEYFKYGAEEFFVGFVPKEWSEKYGWEVCPNRRGMGSNSNYTQIDHLEQTVDTIHKLGGRINLAVNAHDNGSERLSGIRQTVDIMERLNPDGYIVADPAILCSFKSWGIDRPIHLSTGLGCFNSESVRFFCEHFNVERVVIPRKMTLKEMRRFIESLSDLKITFEVMVLGYRCYFNDEDCHSIHSGCHTNLCGEMLTAQRVVSNRMPDNWKDIVQDLIERDNDLFTTASRLNEFCLKWKKDEPVAVPFRDPQCSKPGVFSPMLYHTWVQNCGLCAIKELRDMGVQALKVPLRGTAQFKLPVLQLIHKVMTHPDPTPEYCRQLINCPSFCDALTNCYYDVPEAHK